MKVLIAGSGGREHALAWKLQQSPKVSAIFIAPGNAGTSEIGQNIDVTTKEEIIGWIKKNPVDLVVIGPDNYLAEGIVDDIEALGLGISVFGPTKRAAEIEWSKSFAKKFMKEEGIPTAAYEIFSDIQEARNYIETQNFPLVIKASGLALGKGVIIAASLEEARTALSNIMQNKVFGSAGDEVVIEEYLQGREISIHVFCDGEHARMFPPAQDHKRIFEDDKGPNTGGMGTIAPVPWVGQRDMEEIEKTIVLPTLRALKKRGRIFKGVLFPGIIMTESGPKVIEFNARFGDPETQSYMRILESDLLPVLLACAQGTLESSEIKWSSNFACCIVCASEGYPGEYQKNKVIQGLEDLPESSAVIFHAGTKIDLEKIVTYGGRVLGVTSVGNTLSESLDKAYGVLQTISFEGMQYRKDIGVKSLLKE